ncbi:hypothetical protein CIK05_07025 [Bdellovibrio sp. qaytius]|nr:hypothetical protein CIK05_07025 [Bdellovibrio sp. qaytius]
MKNLILFTVAVFFSFQATAQILSPNATEVDFTYEAMVEAPLDESFTDSIDAARFQAQHMFGIFTSPTVVKGMGINPDEIHGIGGPKSQSEVLILSEEVFEKNKKQMVRIQYKNSGQMILQNKAAAKVLAKGYFNVPLPTNPFKVYRKKCTDSHYNTFGDNWYFYDPYREGCESLSQAPLAQNVVIQVKKAKTRNIQRSAELPLLRGDNGNGDLFSIYLIHGFSADPKDEQDDGRLNYKTAHNYLIENGFTAERLKKSSPYPLNLYKKTVTLSTGETIHIEVKSLLVETSIESKSKVFAEFFKQAVAKADVIIYEGHSGLGGNLNIPELESKAGKFEFPLKKQIFYFDSCSSYSYYLDHFNAYKTKTNIDVVTNGLSSYFHTSPLVLKEFMNYLIGSDNRNFQWMTILKKMESVLGKQSFLVNVGGL